MRSPGRIGVISALSIIVIAARAHGLDALDGVHLDLNDDAGFGAACEQGRDLGFDGKTLIHPKQIPAANAAFAPNPAEIEQSKAIVAAWAEARAAGKGICVLNGKLIEKLHVEDAELWRRATNPRRSPALAAPAAVHLPTSKHEAFAFGF